ncbi:MAG TPA: protease pro-enzyme activation domain-containing protein [Solirubrobacteraceae bacterium]|jgi:subtilase family serine protease|nr:protease pro-enzyme activation domain-containing protein [Solirubrobacteraceae bacterium]
MRFRSLTAMLATTGMAIGITGVSQAATTSAPAVVQASPAAATPANEVGPAPSSTSIDFNVGLQLSDPAGAAELAQAVSNPASPSYHHYLTPAQWEKRFSPSTASVKALTAWLAAEGITVEAVTPDRMTVQAAAPPSVIERAFATSLAEYRSGGRSAPELRRTQGSSRRG